MTRVTHTARGVTYTAIVHSPDRVELRVGAARVGAATLRVRLETSQLLGGDAESGEAILGALETRLAAALAEPAPARAAPPTDGAARERRNRHGGVAGPWYVSAQAVRDYLAILGQTVADDGPDFERAELDLVEMATAIVAAGKAGRDIPPDRKQFRGGRPLRLRLIVSYARRAEGDLPQLVQVLPDNPGRTGPYKRSGASRSGGRNR